MKGGDYVGVFSFLEKRVTMAELESELSVIASNAAGQIWFKELALQIAISYIANTISKCEFKVYEEGEEQHNELYYMLNVNPNPNQNSSQFLNALITRLYRKGEVLVFPDARRNWLYVADGFAVDEKPMSENIFGTISIEKETLRRKYKASDVFYFKLDDVHIKRLIDGAFEQYGAVMQSAIDGFLRRNGKKYKLSLDQYKAGDTAFAEVYEKVLKKQLEAFVTNSNAIYPQFKGTNLEEFDKTTATQAGLSADIINVRKEMFDMVAQAFKIPLAMMYGNITNINDMINMYLTFAIDPIADMIGEEITRKMYPFNEWKNGNYVKVDTSCISHVDIMDVADKVDKAISSGVMSIDEVRKRLDMPLLDDELGNMRFVTKNYSTADAALHPTPAPAPEPAQGQESEPEPTIERKVTDNEETGLSD